MKLYQDPLGSDHHPFRLSSSKYYSLYCLPDSNNSMTNDQRKIEQLNHKLELLLQKHQDFSREISALQIEINKLQGSAPEPAVSDDKPVIKARPVQNPVKHETVHEQSQIYTKTSLNKPPRSKSDIEKFIGENLINKVGIAIVVIGVGIGAKYAIEHQMVSPITRIILGYVVGLGLLGLALKLKKNYNDFSAVLLSGSSAIMYFITFAAYSFYHLFPQSIAFLMMVGFTVYTALSAIKYNRQVIAHIGMIGAYAAPFLLSDGSGKVAILFTYMAIINSGILFIAFKRYWKPLYYFAFTLTWVIFLGWYFTQYNETEHFPLALFFLTVFFALFYITFLAYKLLRKEKFEINDVVMLLSNSFVFYAIGYNILDQHDATHHLLGVFTLANAGVHALISFVVYRQKLADRNIFYLVSGLVLVFITISIPVQLDGNWVTLLWAGEAALLFWIGRSKSVIAYEKLSYPLMILAFGSALMDWSTAYHSYDPDSPESRISPLLNIHFLNSMLFAIAFGFINFVNINTKYPKVANSVKGFGKLISLMVPAIFLLSLYLAFHQEISNYWDQLYADSAITIQAEAYGYDHHHSDLKSFKSVWLLNYTLLFVSIISFVNFKWLRNAKLASVNFSLVAMSVLAFLTLGLFALGDLRESYMDQTLAQHYSRTSFNIYLRYISFGFVALALVSCLPYRRQRFTERNFSIPLDSLIHTSVLWIASNELINALDLMDSQDSYKLGLSIFWGIYSLFLIVLGIWKSKKHLRIGAIALFSVTLIKLFVYDISDLGTISKTIVFVSLGALLLIISFLYNKYRHVISGGE